MNENFAFNSETIEFKSLFRQREKGYTYIGGIKRDLPPAPENEDSNKFKVVYLNRNSQLHNHRMRND